MKYLSVTLTSALAALLLSTGASNSQAEKQYPAAWDRPGATRLIDNDRGAAYHVVYQKDVPSPTHLHRYFFAGLDLNTATQKVTDINGTARLGTIIKDNMWYLPKGLLHTEVSTTDPARDMVVVDIKEKSVPEAVNNTSYPVQKFADYQRKVVENDKAIIWDCGWPSKGEGITGFYGRDVFIAIAEGGDLSIEIPGQAAKVQHLDRAQALFLPAGQARTLKSVNGTIHAMLVELK